VSESGFTPQKRLPLAVMFNDYERQGTAEAALQLGARKPRPIWPHYPSPS
jgi:hypothetical protein